MPLLAARWDELRISWDELGYPDAEIEGTTAAVFFFPGEGMDLSSVNTSKNTAHYCSLLINLQKFWAFSSLGLHQLFLGS